jgi:hypothetical protein
LATLASPFKSTVHTESIKTVAVYHTQRWKRHSRTESPKKADRLSQRFSQIFRRMSRGRCAEYLAATSVSAPCKQTSGPLFCERLSNTRTPLDPHPAPANSYERKHKAPAVASLRYTKTTRSRQAQAGAAGFHGNPASRRRVTSVRNPPQTSVIVNNVAGTEMDFLSCNFWSVASSFSMKNRRPRR